jgi:hypothetical protein
MPKPLPSIVKQYKHKTIYGSIPGRQSTGVYLNEGDVYTILATGRVDRGENVQVRFVGAAGPYFVSMVGKNLYFIATGSGMSARTITSSYSGNLYLGILDGGIDLYGRSIQPHRYEDNTGSFSVDIIVWEREDYIQITDFFEKMKQKDPENKAVADALYDAIRQKEIYLAKAKASRRISRDR